MQQSYMATILQRIPDQRTQLGIDKTPSFEEQKMSQVPKQKPAPVKGDLRTGTLYTAPPRERPWLEAQSGFTDFSMPQP